jgi:hypothetical protein
MKWIFGLLAAALVVCVTGCAQTEPAAMCDHIATLQHGTEPSAAARIKDYKRLCIGPMTKAKLSYPIEYRCWSKCMSDVTTWPDSVQCDGCVGSHEEFELFQVSKTRKKLEQEQARQKDKTSPAPSASSPVVGGSCADDAACDR